MKSPNKKFDYKELCGMAGGVRLFRMKSFDTRVTACDYLCSRYYLNHMDSSGGRIFRRLCGSVMRFDYRTRSTDSNKNILFFFTGDSVNRKDYMTGLEKVMKQAVHASLIMQNRSKAKFSLYNFVHAWYIFVWFMQFNHLSIPRRERLDLCISIYRAYTESHHVMKTIVPCNVSLLVSFCDQWAIDACLITRARQTGIPSATLQHGVGEELYYGFNSDYFLCNSHLSKKEGMKFGIDESRIIVTGLLKYADADVCHYPKKKQNPSIIAALDGGEKNKQSNLEMITFLHTLREEYGVSCAVKFHPSTDIEEYGAYIDEKDEICISNEDFQTKYDIYLVCKSTLFIELIYVRKIIFRYRNPDSDMFPEIKKNAFTDYDGLRNYYLQYASNYEGLIEAARECYEEIYGQQVTGYRAFFETFCKEEHSHKSK